MDFCPGNLIPGKDAFTSYIIIPYFLSFVKRFDKKFTSLIAANGTVESVDEWGKRRLAYEINDKTEGFYVLVDFKADADFPKELDRQYRITDGILRTIIIRKDVK